MKKYLLALCGFVMITALASCGGNSNESSVSESESVVETTAAETTKATTATTKATTKTTTTKASAKLDYTLDEVHKIGDISLKIPKQCSIDNKSVDSGVTDSITFPDNSLLQLAGMEIPYNVDGFSKSEMSVVLNAYAESFISNDTWEKDSEPQDISIGDCPAVKQEATIYKVGGSTLYHFVYGDRIYSLAFIKMPGAATASYDLQKDIIDSIEFSGNKTEAPTNAPTESPANNNESIGQKNALETAKGYIKFSDFSYEGLIDQLEYEKYSHEEAVYGADNCGADWNAEALDCAKSYIDLSDFSYQGLIEQLEYEKFTHEQSVYGADNCGADWNQEAADCTASYIDFSSFSRQELIDQLIYEGFTAEQAEYGVQSVGY